MSGFEFKMIFHYLLKLLLNTLDLWNDLGELISCFLYLMGKKVCIDFLIAVVPKMNYQTPIFNLLSPLFCHDCIII